MAERDPALIAARLTEAQRRAVLWLPKNHEPRLHANWMGKPPRWDVVFRLQAMGLVNIWTSDDWKTQAISLSISPGYAVRRILEPSHDQ